MECLQSTQIVSFGTNSGNSNALTRNFKKVINQLIGKQWFGQVLNKVLEQRCNIVNRILVKQGEHLVLTSDLIGSTHSGQIFFQFLNRTNKRVSTSNLFRHEKTHFVMGFVATLAEYPLLQNTFLHDVIDHLQQGTIGVNQIKPTNL